MTKHLAIFSREGVAQILSGKKTIETRFSQKRIPPYGLVSVGDIVYIKPSGEDVIGQFKVVKVIYFEGLTEDDWLGIRRNFGKKLSLGSPELNEDYFNKRAKARYGTIIFLDEVEQFITSPIRIKKSDLRGWVVL